MNILLDAIKDVFGEILTSLWKSLFPPKSASDQKAADLGETVKEASNAIETEEKVSGESLDDIKSDLAKRVRD